jgi:hypothetical protein
MKRPLLAAGLALAGALLTLACTDTTAPDERFRASIVNISVPDSLAPTDTARVSFDYEDSCGPREVLYIFRHNELTVSVVGTLARDAVCPAIVRYTRRSIAIAPTERAGAYTITFLQPSGADSVRVIHPR